MLSKVFEVISEGRKGSSVDVDLLIQLEHLQKLDRIESKQLKLSRVDRNILEVSKLLHNRCLSDHHCFTLHIILKLKLLFFLILFLSFLFLEEDVLSVHLKGILEDIEDPIPCD